MCSIDWPAFFGVLEDLALAAAAIVTATVAVRGLQSWQRELRGKADFEVARGLARATFKLREAIQSARSPLTRVAVAPLGSPDARAELEAWTRAYKERWDHVAGALQEFDTQSLEAEALWGFAIRKDTQALRACAITLFVAIEAVLDDRANDGDDFKADRDFGRRMRRNAHASPEATDNELSNQITTAVAKLESELRPHLKRPAR